MRLLNIHTKKKKENEKETMQNEISKYHLDTKTKTKIIVDNLANCKK